jgi:hypothetical protein
MWCENNWETSEAMLNEAGFIDIVNALPNDCNTMAICRKPD